ncbi:biotin/lipoyl-containing protein [Bordetella pertussis]|nr:biotin/lipoyl-containing protein [Bordetella pertussis]
MLEVMKLFNTVKAGVAGEIVEILVQEGDMVEEGDVLFRVKPQ